MDRDARLLAHAGAPSSRKDDDRYKAQLHAYLSLDSGTTSRIVRLSLPRDRHSDSHSASATGQGNHVFHDDTPDPTVYIEDTQLGYEALESQLFASTPVSSAARKSASKPTSFTSAESTSMRSVSSRDGCRAAGGEDASVVPQTRVVQERDTQSSYLASPFAARPSKQLRLDNGDPVVGHAQSQVQSPRKAAELDRWQDRAHTLGSKSTADADATVVEADNTSELPSSYSLSKEGSGSLEERPQLSARSAGDFSPFIAAYHERTDQDTKQQLLSYPTSKPGATTRVNSQQDESAAVLVPEDTPRKTRSSDADIAVLERVSTWIQPSPPPTGFGSFDSHLTNALRRLVSNPRISKAYSPTSVSRSLEPLERGYWLVRCENWTIDQQMSFWKKLEESIGSGRAGWGVWCTRGSEAELEPAHGDRVASTDASSHACKTFGPVKVYCWGELVKHIYLLLYVESCSQVRKLGLQWLDADGKVVVQMREASK